MFKSSLFKKSHCFLSFNNCLPITSLKLEAEMPLFAGFFASKSENVRTCPAFKFLLTANDFSKIVFKVETFEVSDLLTGCIFAFSMFLTAFVRYLISFIVNEELTSGQTCFY